MNRDYKALIKEKAVIELFENLYFTVNNNGIYTDAYMDYREEEYMKDFLNEGYKKGYTLEQIIDNFLEAQIEVEGEYLRDAYRELEELEENGTITDTEKEILESYLYVNWDAYINFLKNEKIYINCNIVTSEDLNTELDKKEAINKYFKKHKKQLIELGLYNYSCQCIGCILELSLTEVEELKKNPKQKYRLTSDNFFLYSPIFGGGSCEEFQASIIVKAQHLNIEPFGYSYNDICGIYENEYSLNLEKVD